MKIKTIIRWEQLREKPYGHIDPADEEDFNTLLYVRALEAGTAAGYTLGTFLRAIQRAPQQYSRQVESLQRDMEVMAQFTQHWKDKDKSNEQAPYMSETAAFLIAEGMDAHFVMEELEMQDIPRFMEAYKNTRRERMESARLWTYLTILPHTGSKPFPHGATDLIKFPWEAVPADKDITKEEAAALEAFLQSGRRKIRKPTHNP